MEIFAMSARHVPAFVQAPVSVGTMNSMLLVICIAHMVGLKKNMILNLRNNTDYVRCAGSHQMKLTFRKNLL